MAFETDIVVLPGPVMAAGGLASADAVERRKSMKKRLVSLIKLAVMIAVFAFVFIKLKAAWHTVGSHPVHINWRYTPLMLFGFVGLMLTNALTWRWLAWRMGDRTRTMPLLASYVFSQAGKYAPGKAFLVLLRLERTHRAGMSRETCLLSTLLENAMYTLSGALLGATALLLVSRDHPIYIVLCCAMIGSLLTLFHPKVFFGIVNIALKSMKRAPISPHRRFRLVDMVLAVMMFMPCWFFGGLALWASVRSLHHISLAIWPEMAAVFALSVSLGMFSMLPGGLGVREGVQALFLTPLLGSGELVIVAVALPRVFQITVEMTCALIGGIATSRLPQAPTPAATVPAVADHLPTQ